MLVSFTIILIATTLTTGKCEVSAFVPSIHSTLSSPKNPRKSYSPSFVSSAHRQIHCGSSLYPYFCLKGSKGESFKDVITNENLVDDFAKIDINESSSPSNEMDDFLAFSPIMSSSLIVATFTAIGMTTILGLPLVAEATTGGGGSGVIPSALWAYAHYFSIILVTACLAAERTIIGPNITIEDEETIFKIDAVYGVAAILLIGSGFARAINFGKGGDFYIHEITFWIKMAMGGVWGGLSLFPSTTFLKRKLARQNETIQDVPPVSEKLAKRLEQVVNAEITAILIIPFLATLMARGVGYYEGLPWQIGATLAIAATGGSFFFYAKQAWTWED